MSDEKILETIVKKVDGMAGDVRGNSYKLDRLENMIELLSSNVNTLSAQFNAVGSMAIKDHERINNIEERVEILDGGAH